MSDERLSICAEDFYVRGVVRPFSAKRLREARAIWINDSPDLPEEFRELTDPNEFCEAFGYAIDQSPSFKHLYFDHSRKKTLLAERYGGFGTSDNAGGGRCGNVGAYQLKGIGQNCLVGSGSNVKHSYGGLILVEAVIEAILTEALNSILPNGSVRCYGIIDAGMSAYRFPFDDNRSVPARGGILVREKLPRPAHFFAASYMDHELFRRKGLGSDHTRVRVVNKGLLQRIGINGYAEILALFLRNSASQFGFARIFRLAHSGLSPSNVCIDGRWIDVVLSTFHNSGSNYAVTPDQIHFYDECYFPVRVVNEWVRTLNGSTTASLDGAVLVDYYLKELSVSMSRFFLKLLGFEKLDSTSLVGRELIEKGLGLVDRLAYPKGAEIEITSFEPDPNDSVAQWLSGNLYGLNDAAERGRRAKLRSAIGRERQVFLDTLREAIKLESSLTGVSERVTKTCIAIRQLRPMKFASFYFRGRWRSTLERVLEEDSSASLAHTISSAISVSKWLFSSPNDSVEVICELPGIQILYASDSDRFVVKDRHSEKEIGCSHELRTLCSNLPRDTLTMCGYDFYPRLDELLSIVSVVREESSGACPQS